MATPDLDVRYIARLARLELSDDEVARYQSQLSNVLTFVEALRKVDVSHVEPTAHASPVFNVFRQDEAQASFTPEQALSQRPAPGERPFRRHQSGRVAEPSTLLTFAEASDALNGRPGGGW